MDRGVSETIDAETLEALEALGYVGGDEETERTASRTDFPADCACEWCARFENGN